jgi:hypothetical protein
MIDIELGGGRVYYVKGYRSFLTERIYYTYDICHEYYLYDMHRDQD